MEALISEQQQMAQGSPPEQEQEVDEVDFRICGELGTPDANRRGEEQGARRLRGEPVS